MDAGGVRRRASPAAVRFALRAMGADRPAPPPDAGPLFARPGAALPPGVAAVELEDGSELGPAARLPRTAPPGYHRLRFRDGSERELITSPGRCFLPPLRGWGWAAQLYALRSQRSWGMGDLAELRALCTWARGAGADVVQLNPLHAARVRPPQEASPYFPSSRLFRNPLYIAVDEVDGARDDPEIAELARQARALNGRAVIDRDAVHTLKMRALARCYERFTGSRDFAAYCEREGDTLLRYACFCVLTERHAERWQEWPAQFRHPGSPAVARLADAERRRVNFHRWLQWLLERQLERARGTVTVMHDVAVGFAPDGADAWLWQDLLAPGARIGAPPDEFNPAGQDWGLPAFDPHRLRAAGYGPLRETMRAVMRRDSAVRIDHVMGLFRLWWVPADGGPRDGVYVRYPARELLDVVALESARARCYVVGEDLGTVEEGVRAEMRRRRMLSYRVAWFEDRPPRRYPRQALAALTTHDLPTVAGVWTGADVREMVACGVAANLDAEAGVRRRLARLARAHDGDPVERVIERAHTALATAASALVMATLEDAAASPRRPNVPGATRRPNWSLPLPRTLEQLRRAALPRRIARALGRHA